MFRNAQFVLQLLLLILIAVNLVIQIRINRTTTAAIAAQNETIRHITEMLSGELK